MSVTDQFKCPFCGGRLYRSSRSGKQVYKCNDLTDNDCPSGLEAVARTKPQVRRAIEEIDRNIPTEDTSE
jgi:ribosomal protein L37AE/L43A